MSLLQVLNPQVQVAKSRLNPRMAKLLLESDDLAAVSQVACGERVPEPMEPAFVW